MGEDDYNKINILLFPKSIPPHKKRRRRMDEWVEETERRVQEGGWLSRTKGMAHDIGHYEKGMRSASWMDVTIYA